MVANTVFLGWNRRRLRGSAGPAPRAFEVFEVVLIIAMTLGAAAFAALLARVIAVAT
jgi:hypothetical protein